ncbi:tyrosine-type recombinase/integrase [Cytobacillus kochii]|uniref:tyrosine-type recombinase/integrase n=1 Tax=Cytobacillus kochii TaxID=859143 RepID=UPI002480C62A|nr:tyrosine-type recombinase/integrase [Cytobacillus kochii]
MRKSIRKGVIRKSVESLDDLFQTFLSIKRAEGRAETTMQQYRDNFSFFMEFLEIHDIEPVIYEINRTVIREYVTYMREDWVRFDGHRFKSEKEKTVGLKPSTINTRLKTLRVLFKCLYEEELIETNPAQGVSGVREPQERIEILTTDELKRLLRVLDKRSYSEFRDYVLINLLIDGMARISETINLKIEDFDFNGKTFTIPATIAKSRKARTVPIEQRTARLIKELNAENKKDFETDYIFLTVYGEKISGDHFRKRLNDYAKRAGIRKNIHPHLFRHTAATMFLENGGDIRHLQMLLGHADMRVVMRYTHLSNNSLRKQHDQFAAINQVIDKRSLPRKIKRKI